MRNRQDLFRTRRTPTPQRSDSSRALELAAAALLTIVVSCSGGGGGGGSSGGSSNPGGSSTIEIVRDHWGVPHVFATSDTGAYYGLGWAAAEDRFLQMTWGRLELEGRVAEFLGADPGDGSDVFVEHDIVMRLSGFARLAESLVSNLDPATRALLEAYADGVNDYLASPGSSLHPDFAALGLPLEAWRAQDSVAAWLRLGVFVFGNVTGEVALRHRVEDLEAQGLSPAEIVDELLGEQVFDELAAVAQQSDVPTATQDAMAAYASSLGLPASALPSPAWWPRDPVFSQAWAVSGRATTSGETVVVSDPRLSIFVPNALWEAHAVGATFEARGAAPPGSANFLVGATRDVAWGVTALTMDQADLLQVETDALGHPGQYFIDGAWKDFLVDETETVLVAGGSPAILRYRESEWGPLVTRFAGDTLWIGDVEADEEYALHWVMASTPDASVERAFLDLYRAPDASQFAAGLAGWTAPSLHAIFGDRSGTVGFWTVGELPVRASHELLAGRAAQDGTTSASQWLDLVPHYLKPGLLDPVRNFVYAANQLPVGAWYPIPFVTHGGHSSRSARLLERLEQELPDPTATTDVDRILDLRSDPVWVFARDLALIGLALRDGLVGVAGAPAQLSPQAQTTLQELESWADSALDGPLIVDLLGDGALDASQPKAGALAFHLGQIPFRSSDLGGPVAPELIAAFGFGEPGLAFFLRSMRGKLSGGVDLLDAEAEFVELALETALSDTVTAAGGSGSWASWFDINVQSADLQNFGSLLGNPPFGASSVPVGPVTAGGAMTLAGQLEAAHTQTVTLTSGAAPSVQTLLPLGQSERTSSPHYHDQRPLWESAPQTLKAQPFDRSSIEALAGPTTTTTLQEGSGIAGLER